MCFRMEDSSVGGNFTLAICHHSEWMLWELAATGFSGARLSISKISPLVKSSVLQPRSG